MILINQLEKYNKIINFNSICIQLGKQWKINSLTAGKYATVKIKKNAAFQKWEWDIAVG